MSKRLAGAIRAALARRGLTPYKVSVSAGWDPSFMAKVVLGHYVLGRRRLNRLVETLDRLGHALTTEERREWVAAYAADKDILGECPCDVCLAMRDLAPDLLYQARQVRDNCCYGSPVFA